ncbi:MAG: hypothetical protein OQK67_05695 [Chlorobium sp.]|nr:hypothetical protein [Chlorobium sp.]MCW8814542.1 hypothetical protein [Chlorobium sp.]MCW8819327.1 hypothetical protein [Ignavibacteriaceae bacterium]
MIARILLFIVPLFCTAGTVLGSFEHSGPDARVEAMGGAGCALENHPFSTFYNPASRGGVDARSAGISYTRPFGNSTLDSFYASVSTSDLPFDRNGNAGISYHYFGSSLYRETSTFFTYSTRVAGPVRAGISAGLLERDSGENNPVSALGINLGAIAALSPSLDAGIAFFNVNRPDMGDGEEKAPLTSFIGASYRPAEDIVLSAAAEKQENRSFRLRSGGEVRVASFLFLRAGFTTDPSTFSGGAGFRYNAFQGDISLKRHPELGTGTWYTMKAFF